MLPPGSGRDLLDDYRPDLDAGSGLRREAPADVGEVGRVAGIAGEERPERRMLEDPAAPQRLVAIGQRPLAPVLNGNAMDGDAPFDARFPPDGNASVTVVVASPVRVVTRPP